MGSPQNNHSAKVPWNFPTTPDNYYSSHLGKLLLEPHLGKTSDAFLSLSTLNRVSDTECHHKCMEVSSLGPTSFVCVLHLKCVVPSVTVLPSSYHGCGRPRLTAIGLCCFGSLLGLPGPQFIRRYLIPGTGCFG